jgi:acetyl esterase/lipase
MTFALDAQVAAVLDAAFARSGPPPALPAGDVAGRRVALDAMLGYFNNQAQPVAGKVDISDHRVLTPDGAGLLARWYRRPSGDSRAAVLYLHGGGMIAGSVPVFDGPVSRYVARTGVSMLSLEYRLAPEHPIPLRSRTPTPGWSGSPGTRPSSASTPAASRSWATAPAAGSRPASRS